MGNGHETRPDGRVVSPKTQKLRVATRALRSHLDVLPIDYDFDVAPDRFLTGLAFMFARQRYDCADSMIGAGFGGTVLGSIARSLFVDGLRWLWIGQCPQRRRSLLGDLLDERNRLCMLLEVSEASCPILPRWLMPLPDVADLTGCSLSWLDAPAMPTEDELLEDFLASSDANPRPPKLSDGMHLALLGRTRTLLGLPGLRGAVMVLAHAGHGNYLGIQSSFTADGVPGHDLRADHEALFMQVAAIGTVATLVGAAAAAPESWPSDVGPDIFLQRAVDLAGNVASLAAVVHQLGAKKPTQRPPMKLAKPYPKSAILRSNAVLSNDDLLPDVNSVKEVAAAAEVYDSVARSFLIQPWDYGPTSLHETLAYGAARSNLQTVMSTWDQPGSAVVAVFAARMLLEESARLQWRFSVESEDEFKDRAKQFFDEFRSRERKTIDKLVNSGISRRDAERIFQRPDNVRFVTSNRDIAKGRKPLPSIGSMLREIGGCVSGTRVAGGRLFIAQSDYP